MRIGSVIAVFLALATGAAGAETRLPPIQSWAYWLQNISIPRLAASDHDLVVIDYSRNGSDARRFRARDIRRLKASGKTVLAYFSIGEAEDYRFYWKSGWEEGRPRFVGPENPEFPGNYKVRFWTEAWWRRALRPYLARILRAGFDGVYLDIIDAYDFWSDEDGIPATRSANRMARLVRRIARYARARAGADFAVCPQNGASIIDDASAPWQRRYLATVDCIAVEDLWFNIHGLADQRFRLRMLRRFDAAGLPILSVDYISRARHRRFFRRIEGSGLDMIGYPGARDRELDELIVVR